MLSFRKDFNEIIINAYKEKVHTLASEKPFSDESEKSIEKIIIKRLQDEAQKIIIDIAREEYTSKKHKFIKPSLQTHNLMAILQQKTNTTSSKFDAIILYMEKSDNQALLLFQCIELALSQLKNELIKGLVENVIEEYPTPKETPKPTTMPGMNKIKITTREAAQEDAYVISHRLLGQGSYGAVYLGMFNGKEVAIKQMSYAADIDAFRAYAAEKTMMEMIANMEGSASFVPSYLGFSVRSAIFSIAMEYFPDGNLEQYINQHLVEVNNNIKYIKKDFDNDFTTRYCIAQRLAAALNFLHENAIVHGDIKPGNIFVKLNEKDNIPQIKIGDFGHAVPVKANGGSRKSPIYAAPELYDGTTTISTITDVYSFALTLLQLITGREPYADLIKTVQNQWRVTVTEEIFKSHIINKGKREAFYENEVNEHNRKLALVVSCGLFAPQMRPSAQDLHQHLKTPKDRIAAALSQQSITYHPSTL